MSYIMVLIRTDPDRSGPTRTDPDQSGPIRTHQDPYSTGPNICIFSYIMYFITEPILNKFDHYMRTTPDPFRTRPDPSGPIRTNSGPVWIKTGTIFC